MTSDGSSGASSPSPTTTSPRRVSTGSMRAVVAPASSAARYVYAGATAACRRSSLRRSRMTTEPFEVTLYTLLMKLKTGGCIIGSAFCTSEELARAKSTDCYYEDKDGTGYVYRDRRRAP